MAVGVRFARLEIEAIFFSQGENKESEVLSLV